MKPLKVFRESEVVKPLKALRGSEARELLKM
ncbi:hypothetical protein A2U01_0114610, partial [Trifolium medium]|nr:hypothetical protein [Trifolium medium]